MTGTHVVINIRNLQVVVKEQEEGVSVYMYPYPSVDINDCIAETYALWAEGYGGQAYEEVENEERCD